MEEKEVEEGERRDNGSGWQEVGKGEKRWKE